MNVSSAPNAARARYHASVNTDFVDTSAPGYSQAGSPGARAKALRQVGSVAGSNARGVYLYGRRDVAAGCGTCVRDGASRGQRTLPAKPAPDPGASGTSGGASTGGTAGGGGGPACDSASERAWGAWTQPKDPFTTETIETQGITRADEIGGDHRAYRTLSKLALIPNDPGTYLGLGKAGYILKFPLNTGAAKKNPRCSLLAAATSEGVVHRSSSTLAVFPGVMDAEGCETKCSADARCAYWLVHFELGCRLHPDKSPATYKSKSYTKGQGVCTHAADDPGFVFGKGFGGYTGSKTHTCGDLTAKQRSFWCAMCEDGTEDDTEGGAGANRTRTCIKDRCAATCAWGSVGVMLPVQMCGPDQSRRGAGVPTTPVAGVSAPGAAPSAGGGSVGGGRLASGCAWSYSVKSKEYIGIGLAVDPAFAVTGHVYLMSAAPIDTGRIRITRFTAVGFKAGDALSGRLADGVDIWEDVDTWSGSIHPGGTLVITPRGHMYASRAVQFHPHGGQSDFVWLSARTPHGAYVC